MTMSPSQERADFGFGDERGSRRTPLLPGASGCALASTLAKGLPNHQILLLEGGGKNDDKAYTTLAERHWALVAPGYNWGYKTIPQKHLDDREIDQSRGKGLGGSTAINFCVYTRGPEADYDRWADLVGDSDWAWKSSLSRYRRIEKCRQPSTKYQEMVHIATKDHGEDGPVDVAVPDTFEPGFTQYMDAIYKHHPKNLDVNSGNPVGAAIQQNAMVDGQRVSARTAFLKDVPSNLSIKTEITVHKVLFEGKKAVGVEHAGGKSNQAPI
ncbi:MAG: hypothetical protein OHK93_001634 [Ramalina farinacea]|uniref:Glucose-methanol-choline oxidoreductase N-terminal domain-containing protein n=1 Tax=Ramalina farinacea TaxID=258253 RepID=A0AA43QPT8_9LECA|nr:hypothetical protein [Ramalina farinacea]